MKKEISPASMCRQEFMEQEFCRLGMSEFTGDSPLPPETWAFVKIDCSRIDREKSLLNQARLNNALDEQNLKEIQMSLEEGKKLPAIIVFPNKYSQKFEIGDGNHRFEKSSDYQSVMAYVVNTANEDLKRRITLLANQWHGLKNPEEVRITHAANECEHHGMTEEDAALMFHVQRGKIREELAHRKFQAAFGSIPKSGALDRNIQRAISDVKDKLGLSNTGKLVKLAVSVEGITANQIREYGNKYKNSISASEQEALISDMDKHFDRVIKQKKHGGTLKSKRQKKVLDKDEFVRLVNKLADMFKLPHNNLSAKLSQDEAAIVYAVQVALQNDAIPNYNPHKKAV
jgi:hypothetical protein